MEKCKTIFATGIDIHGRKIGFDYSDGWLSCYGNKLISLNIPEGVKNVHCSNNQLTELILPEGVNWLWADKEVLGLEKYMGKKVKIILY